MQSSSDCPCCQVMTAVYRNTSYCITAVPTGNSLCGRFKSVCSNTACIAVVPEGGRVPLYLMLYRVSSHSPCRSAVLQVPLNFPKHAAALSMQQVLPHADGCIRACSRYPMLPPTIPESWIAPTHPLPALPAPCPTWGPWCLILPAECRGGPGGTCRAGRATAAH